VKVDDSVAEVKPDATVEVKTETVPTEVKAEAAPTAEVKAEAAPVEVKIDAPAQVEVETGDAKPALATSEVAIDQVKIETPATETTAAPAAASQVQVIDTKPADEAKTEIKAKIEPKADFEAVDHAEALNQVINMISNMAKPIAGDEVATLTEIIKTGSEILQQVWALQHKFIFHQSTHKQYIL
jgi:hypothetical protein